MVIDYGKLIYGDVDSSDYGIYISGEGVYNAPERAVEFVNVPGRNGAIALDQGRYENIQVTYPAMVLENDQESFRERLGRFRNAILSQKGYQRLEDSYHPDEFRMGVYHAGLSVSDLLTYHKGGNLELTFDCKPQRWLTVGDYPIPVESGDVLENPTPFSSGPLLEIDGYGSVWFNGHHVKLDNAVLGNTLLNDSFVARISTTDQSSIQTSQEVIFDDTLFNIGDTITVKASKFDSRYYTPDKLLGIDTQSGSGSNEGALDLYIIDAHTIDVEAKFSDIEITAGTAKTCTYTSVVTFKEIGGSTLGTLSVTGSIAYTYSSGIHSIVFQVTATRTSGDYLPQGAWINGGKVVVNSTLSILGNPTYIDCDIGEAYRIVNGAPVSLNSKVYLGSDLPNLSPGSNKITFSNTITDLKIAPRWWRV